MSLQNWEMTETGIGRSFDENNRYCLAVVRSFRDNFVLVGMKSLPPYSFDLVHDGGVSFATPRVSTFVKSLSSSRCFETPFWATGVVTVTQSDSPNDKKKKKKNTGQMFFWNATFRQN